MDYLALYSIYNEYCIQAAMLFFVIAWFIFAYVLQIDECDDIGSIVINTTTAPFVSMVIFATLLGSAGQYVAEQTDEYKFGYNEFPNTEIYDEIIEIHNENWNNSISKKLDDRLWLYKIGFEDAMDNADKQKSKTLENSLENQTNDRTDNILQRIYNVS
jgi:hypothetical protein